MKKPQNNETLWLLEGCRLEKVYIILIFSQHVIQKLPSIKKAVFHIDYVIL